MLRTCCARDEELRAAPLPYPQGKAVLGRRLSGNVAQVLETPKLKIDLDLSVDTNVVLQAYRGYSLFSFERVYLPEGMPDTLPSSQSPRKADFGQDFVRMLALSG